MLDLLERRPLALPGLILGLAAADGLAFLLLGWWAARRRRKISVSPAAVATLFVALSLTSCARRPEVHSPDAGSRSPSPEEVDLGTVRQGQTLSHTFRVANRTEHPITIQRVGSS